MRQFRTLLFFLFVLALSFGGLLAGSSPALAASHVFPKTIQLPDGFRPEGIVSGHGTDFYAGSLADGSIFKGNLRTGKGEILVTGPGEPAVGLSFDERTGFLFVSGGPIGTARVYDTRDGSQVGFYQFATGTTFVNDAVVTTNAAYFTDSFQPVLYKLPLSPNGALPAPSDFEVLPLGGDFVMGPGFNVNGIDANSQGDALVIVQSGLGRLYRVDPSSGWAALIDLGGESVSAGDGILLEGFTLYVLRNQLNQIAVVELVPDLSAGSVAEDPIEDPAFDVPTTLLRFGSHLYAVNARFTTPPTPTTEYAIVKVDMP